MSTTSNVDHTHGYSAGCCLASGLVLTGIAMESMSLCVTTIRHTTTTLRYKAQRQPGQTRPGARWSSTLMKYDYPFHPLDPLPGLSAAQWLVYLTIYLIRHGEKPESGNGLSAVGEQRAQCLSLIFRAEPISSYNIGYIMAQTPKENKDRLASGKTESIIQAAHASARTTQSNRWQTILTGPSTYLATATTHNALPTSTSIKDPATSSSAGSTMLSSISSDFRRQQSAVVSRQPVCCKSFVVFQFGPN